MPLFCLLFIAFATGALAARAGREEVRHSADPLWRMEAFLAYALFACLVLLPTTIYFYVFHGDWFLLYFADTAHAPWILGIAVVLVVAAVAVAGFRLGAALCRASRDRLLRRVATVAFVLAVGVWPLGWSRLSVVGSYREFTRSYGLTAYFASPVFYAGLAMLILVLAAFVWVILRVDSHTHERV
ncbi:MAG: hypothetical protein WBG86_22445 [Polyangiales bacterium]